MKRAVAFLFGLMLTFSAASANAAVVRGVWEDDDGDRLALYFDDEIAIPGQAAIAIEIRLSGAQNVMTYPVGGPNEIINSFGSAPTRLAVLAGTADPLNFSYTDLGNPDILSVVNDGVGGALGFFTPLNGTLNLVAIPEPTTAGLLLLGIAGVVRHRRRRA